jgi:membrane protease YdiL (CAAX protease family)
MAASATPGRVLTSQPEWLILPVTIALVVFHYATRADTLGVLSHGRAWVVLTLPPLSPTAHFALSGLLLGVGPVALARILARVRSSDLGLGLGRPRVGLAWLAVGLPLALLAGWIGSGAGPVRAVYPLDATLSPDLRHFIPHALRLFLYFGAWEVLFRGVLLFGLRDRLGPLAANLLQTGMSVTAHFGRPLSETIAAIPAGLVFGWVDLRVGSVWYIAVIHWVVGVSLDYFILLHTFPGH